MARRDVLAKPLIIGSANATAAQRWSSRSTGRTKEIGRADAGGPSSRATSCAAASFSTAAMTPGLRQGGASVSRVAETSEHETNAGARPARAEVGQGSLLDSKRCGDSGARVDAS